MIPEPREEGNLYSDPIVDPVNIDIQMPPELLYVKGKSSGVLNLVFSPIANNSPARDTMLLELILTSNLDEVVVRSLTDLLVSRHGTSVPQDVINTINARYNLNKVSFDEYINVLKKANKMASKPRKRTRGVSKEDEDRGVE